MFSLPAETSGSAVLCTYVSVKKRSRGREERRQMGAVLRELHIISLAFFLLTNWATQHNRLVSSNQKVIREEDRCSSINLNCTNHYFPQSENL